MADPRLTKLAQVITEYSTEIKRGDRVFITASPLAQPLTLAVIEQVIRLGGLPHITAGSGYHHLDLAPGAAYPDTGGVNKSAIHWDLICESRDGTEMTVDGVPFYRNGEFLIK
jgi:leucyl aminopeptidase (aminopeptidase T)